MKTRIQVVARNLGKPVTNPLHGFEITCTVSFTVFNVSFQQNNNNFTRIFHSSIMFHFCFQDTFEQTIVLHVCLRRGSVPVSEGNLQCPSHDLIELSSWANESVVRYFPYPEPGPWFLGLQGWCLPLNETNVRYVLNVRSRVCVRTCTCMCV